MNDTDSDSGISVEISNDSPSTPVIREPITTKEQEAPLPNYTAMVQEAIVGMYSEPDPKNETGPKYAINKKSTILTQSS